MLELHSLGNDFFIPFFNRLWQFLDVKFLFGLSFRNILLGCFLVSVSTNLISMVFGVGSGGLRAYQNYTNKGKKEQHNRYVSGDKHSGNTGSKFNA